MLRLPPFELLQPATLAEALELKKLHGEDAMYTSGGTDLYPNMKRRQFEPHFLIALKGIEELSRIEIKNITSQRSLVGSERTLNWGF